MQRIIGLDPGGTTGIVSFTVSSEGINCVESYELDLYGVGEYLEDTWLTDTIVAWEVANKFQASGHVSSEVIGLIKYIAGREGAEMKPVTQSSHKKLISRDVLKRAGLYVKGTHAKDAAGVGLYVAVTHLKLVQGVLRPEEAA